MPRSDIFNGAMESGVTDPARVAKAFHRCVGTGERKYHAPDIALDPYIQDAIDARWRDAASRDSRGNRKPPWLLHNPYRPGRARGRVGIRMPHTSRLPGSHVGPNLTEYRIQAYNRMSTVRMGGEIAH